MVNGTLGIVTRENAPAYLAAPLPPSQARSPNDPPLVTDSSDWLPLLYPSPPIPHQMSKPSTEWRPLDLNVSVDGAGLPRSGIRWYVRGTDIATTDGFTIDSITCLQTFRSTSRARQRRCPTTYMHRVQTWQNPRQQLERASHHHSTAPSGRNLRKTALNEGIPAPSMKPLATHRNSLELALLASKNMLSKDRGMVARSLN